MTETACPFCRAKIPIPEGEGGEKVAVVCQECGSRLQVLIPSETPSDTGAETLFYPQLPSEALTDEQETQEIDEGAGGATTVPVGSRMLPLDLKKQAACPRCGGDVPIPVAVTCQRCGAQWQVLIPSDTPSDTGAETLFHPQSLAEGLEETEEVDEGTGGPPTAPVGAGTVFLDPKKHPSAIPRLKTAVKGFLILASAAPGEKRLPLVGAKTVVGREGADIVIDDPALSSRHFEVEARGNEFFIRDLGSSNGTLVNRNRVRARQLTSGDKIQAGETTFTFRILKVIPWVRSK